MRWHGEGSFFAVVRPAWAKPWRRKPTARSAIWRVRLNPRVPGGLHGGARNRHRFGLLPALLAYSGWRLTSTVSSRTSNGRSSSRKASLPFSGVRIRLVKNGWLTPIR